MINLPVSDLIYSFDYKIISTDTDINARLKLSTILNLLIEAAHCSANRLGFGYDNLKENELFWVLNRLSISIERPLMWREQIKVRTWPRDIVKILYLRDFLITDANDLPVIKATSAWIPVDLNSRRPKKLDESAISEFTELRDLKIQEHIPKKIPKSEITQKQIVTSTFSDIDLNKHVNSGRYVEWLMNTIPAHQHEKRYPQEFSINYIKETLPDEKIEIGWSREGNNYNFVAINLNSDKTVFRSKINFHEEI